MIKTDNLYAEVVINESPFFYDENGRLRVRVLEEQAMISTADSKMDEKGNTAPSSTVAVKDEEPVMKAAVMPRKEAKAELRALKGEKKAMKMAGKPIDPAMKEKIMAAKQKVMQNPRNEKAVPPTKGNDKTDSGMNIKSRPEQPTKTAKPLRSFRFSSQSRAGAGRNVNTRTGLRGASGGMRAYALEEGALPATEYLEMYEESMVQDQKPMEPTTVTAAPEKAVEKKPVEKKPMEKKALSPEEQAARKAKTEKSLADWRAKNPEKAAENLQKAKEKTEKFVTDLKNLKKTDPGAYKARIDKARETMKAKNPEKFAAKEAKKAEFANKMKGLKDKIQKNRDLRAAKKSSKPSAGGMVKTTTALQEKMDLQKAEMGDVIKDFQKSDAPQFKGKSHEKRRIMAIAAKLQADRGTK